MSESPSTVSQPGGGRRRGGTRLINLILVIGVIAAIALFVWAEQQRRSVANQLEQTATQLEEVKKSTQRGGEELAAQVLSKLRAHMIVPEDPKPTVATIVDIEKLKTANAFYGVAENGDHLIITENRAILYDPDRDIILDVVPVRINRTSPSPTAAGSSSQSNTTTAPTSTPATDQ